MKNASVENLYYGMNLQTKNEIQVNRRKSGARGLIMGQQGTGKTTICKQEIQQVLDGSEFDRVIVVDPYGEYAEICRKYHGEVVTIADGSEDYINIMDFCVPQHTAEKSLGILKDEIQYAVFQKIDSLIAICEFMLKHGNRISNEQSKLITTCAKDLYSPYIKEMEEKYSSGKEVAIDRQKCPTLKDLFRSIKAKARTMNPDIKELLDAMEPFCEGYLDLFAHHTSITCDSRFLVYDLSHLPENTGIGSGLKKMAMMVCLEDAWMRIKENYLQSIRDGNLSYTWLYVDDAWRVSGTDGYSAKCLRNIYNSVRTQYGIITSVVTSIMDLALEHVFLSLSDFIVLTNQDAVSKDWLKKYMYVSEEDTEYLNGNHPFAGLILPVMENQPFQIVEN